MVKRVGPVLVLGLILGCTYLLVNSGRLALVSSDHLQQEVVTFKYSTLYTGCHHEELTEKSYPQKNWAEILETQSKEGWEIKNFNSEQVELAQEVMDLCPGCQEKEFIGLYGNEIGVYAGSPDKPGPVKQVIPVNTGRLPSAEIEDLKAGIICDEAQDKWQILEGYQN